MFKERRLTRDRVLILLAIGGAIANKKMAEELNLNGLPKDYDLVALAEAVATLHEHSSGQQHSDALHAVDHFLSSLSISRPTKVSVRKQILNEVNLCATYHRGMRWMKQQFGTFLRPKGNRTDCVNKFKAIGFKE